MLFYYAIYAVIVLVYFEFSIADADLFIEALETYFRCEALGHLPNQTSQCDPKEYQQYIYPELATTNYFLGGFITTANLTFVINWSAVTKFCLRYYHEKEKSSKFMFSNSHLPAVSDITDSTRLQ